jgi:hypothetical protein
MLTADQLAAIRIELEYGRRGIWTVSLFRAAEQLWEAYEELSAEIRVLTQSESLQLVEAEAKIKALTSDRDEYKALFERYDAQAFEDLIKARDEALAEAERLRNERILSVVFGHHKGAPRPFGLYRRQDETGVSGTGVVAVGVEFPDGMVVLRWTSAFPTSVVFHERGIESVEAIHGHGGKTQIVWLSDELEPLAQMEQERDLLAAQRDEVLELCNDAQQVIGQRGFLAVDAIRAVFAAVDALDVTTPGQDQADDGFDRIRCTLVAAGVPLYYRDAPSQNAVDARSADAGVDGDGGHGARAEEPTAARSQRDLAETRIAAVLAYVAKLPCSNCDHVHNDGDERCSAAIPGYGRPCGCTWGPNDITKDIRDLLAKEKPE